MTRFISPLALAAALSLPLAAQSAPVMLPDAKAMTTAGADLHLAKNDKGKGKAKAKGKKKAKKKAKAAKVKIKRKNGEVKAEIKQGKNKAKVEVKDGKRKVEIDGDADFTRQALTRLSTFGVPLAVLGTAGLADVLIDCPPGLADRVIPCVPPGQAKKGVTAEEWAGRNDEELRVALIERQRDLDIEIEREYELEQDIEIENDAKVIGEDDDRDPFVNDFALSQDRIIEIFDLDPAPEDHAYIVVDGRPVLLDNENYQRIRLLRGLDEVQIFDVEDLDITSVMGHDGLAAAYDLPEPPAEHYYAAVDGEVLLLPLKAYEMMQLLRIAAIAPTTLVNGG